MASSKVCCVPGCKSNRYRGLTTLHKFPNPDKDRERFNTWVYSIGGDILGLDNGHIFKYRRVCYLHFLDKYMCSSNRLSNNSVPTLNMPVCIGKERKTLQGHEKLSTESTPTAPEPPAQEDDNLNDDDESLHQLFVDTPRKLTEKTTVEKNIAPETAAREEVPPASQSTADIDNSDSQNISKTHQVKKIVQKTLGFEDMDSFKLKFKNILHNTKFCGICMESNESMNSVEDDLEIVVYERTYAKPLQGLIDEVFKEDYSLASSYVCNRCLDKLIQSYIFIETAIETSKMFNNYVNDLFSISSDIFNHLPESKIEIKNVVIVLENNNNDSLEGKDKTNESLEEKNESINLVRKKFKCVRCLSMLPTHRDLKIHKLTCQRRTFQCRTCLKLFRNKQRLIAHHKLHLKVKCKFCHEIVLKKELLDHFKTNHGDTLIKCLKCELYYTLNTHKSHTKNCQQIKEDKQQCLMCLKTFTEIEFKSHTCKHSCPECTEVPCMHYKYLKSYREQVLNNADKIKCFYCDYVCKKKEILLGHVNRDHFYYQPYICDTCGKEFYSKVALRTHILRYHENSFVCQFCDSEFSNIDKYERHVESCEDIKRDFACENCPASFDTSGRLTNHLKRRHGADIFPCGLCSKHFLKDSERREHIVKVHGDLDTTKRVKTERCLVCQAMFDNKRELVQHMKSHNGPNVTYPCTICNTEYSTVRQFQAHNRKHKGPFATCHVCGKQMREILLEKHLTTHSTAIQTCETCGRSFKNITLLKYHQKVHLESVPCPKCKKMMNPAKLRRHWKRHVMEDCPEKKQQPKSKCKLCEYTTWNSTLLECHMNRHHLKIKPYICHICSKDFIGKHLLRKHLETHDEKSVVCMICLKSFANATCLKLHLRLHTGEKPFTCEICGDRFRTISILNVHKLKKHSDKSNVCPLCSSKFHTVRDVRRHMIRVHWKQKDKSFDPRELKGLDEKHYHLFHDGRRVKIGDEDIEFYMPNTNNNLR